MNHGSDFIRTNYGEGACVGFLFFFGLAARCLFVALFKFFLLTLPRRPHPTLQSLMQFCTRSPLDDSQPAVMVVGFGWFDWACAASSASSFRLLIFKLDCLGISPVPAKLPLVPISHPSRLFRTPPRSFYRLLHEEPRMVFYRVACVHVQMHLPIFQRFPLSRILSPLKNRLTIDPCLEFLPRSR